MSTTREKRQDNMAKARAVQAKKKNKKQNRPLPVEPISPEKAYPVRLVPALLGIGRWTLRKAEKEGMRTGGLGVSKYVMGSELIKHIFSKKS